MSEVSYVRGALWATFAGVATVAGVLFIPFLNKDNEQRLTAGSLAFAAGVMLWVAFVDVLGGASVEFFENHFNGTAPDAEHNGVWVRSTIFGCFFAGIMLTWQLQLLTERYLDGHEHAARDVDVELAGVDKANPTQGENVNPVPPLTSVMQLDTEGQLTHSGKSALMRVSYVAMVALALHNFPEGLATFFDGSKGSGTIAIAIAMHNVPEGAAIAVPMYQSTGSISKAIWATFIAGLTQPFGALVGWLFIIGMGIENISEFAYGVIYTSTAGIMVAISILELIPAALAYPSSGFVGSCIFAGFAVMEASIIMLEYAL
jgi:ZIP family zinc transporter